MNHVKLVLGKMFLTAFFLISTMQISFSYSINTSGSSFSPTNASSVVGDIEPLPRLNKEFLVVVHIIKDDQGQPGVEEAAIYERVEEMNIAFEPIAASFNVCEIRYIDEYRYDYMNDERRNELMTKYQLENRINIFITGEFEDEEVCGNADLVGVVSAFRTGIVIKKGDCNNATTFIHEMGHFFGLPHTFQGSGVENVDGSNCTTAGDGVCDTPADPYNTNVETSTYVNDQCEFIYTGKDANGDYYDPDVSNVMGYYSACRCLKFTDGQYRKMADYYLSNPFTW